jgi:hypothetical protein
MNQALYAHMNNKRKMGKKKKGDIPSQEQSMRTQSTVLSENPGSFAS